MATLMRQHPGEPSVSDEVAPERADTLRVLSGDG